MALIALLWVGGLISYLPAASEPSKEGPLNSRVHVYTSGHIDILLD